MQIPASSEGLEMAAAPPPSQPHCAKGGGFFDQSEWHGVTEGGPRACCGEGRGQRPQVLLHGVRTPVPSPLSPTTGSSLPGCS